MGHPESPEADGNRHVYKACHSERDRGHSGRTMDDYNRGKAGGGCLVAGAPSARGRACSPLLPLQARQVVDLPHVARVDEPLLEVRLDDGLQLLLALLFQHRRLHRLAQVRHPLHLGAQGLLVRRRQREGAGRLRAGGCLRGAAGRAGAAAAEVPGGALEGDHKGEKLVGREQGPGGAPDHHAVGVAKHGVRRRGLGAVGRVQARAAARVVGVRDRDGLVPLVHAGHHAHRRHVAAQRVVLRAVRRHLDEAAVADEAWRAVDAEEEGAVVAGADGDALGGDDQL
mmetsp:Transcript_3096/g.7748  ORF Transcript_3096/g.7748 Transcript_3096/m.7748 type:complete len:284 (+) Transcript_3096:984-1835(+)